MKQKVTSLLFVCLCTAIIAGCTSSVRFATKDVSAVPGITKTTEYSKDQISIITEAEKWIGTPYCYGGESRSCADCSGFVQQVFQSVGMYIPRTAARQYLFALRVKNGECKPGDLVFFKNASKINHVGIYLGNNQFIHASSSNGVEKQSLGNHYYQSRFAGFGRFIN